MTLNKKYQVKIFQSDGTTLINTINPNEIRNEITFSSRINGGFGALTLVLNRKFDDFNENVDIKADNIVKVFEFDEVNVDPVLIYTGYISKYNPFLRGSDEGVEITILGLISFLSRDYYKSGTSYTVNITNIDVGAMARAIIDQVNTIFNLFTYTIGVTAKDTGVLLDKDFEKQKWFDAIRAVNALAPDGWWWKIDEQGVFYFLEKPSTTTHTFTIGKDIDQLEGEKDFETIQNFVTVFFGGAGSGLDRSDSTSIATYGKHTGIYDQSDLNATAAGEFADKKLADNKDPKINTRLRINTKFNIETIKVGDTCRIRNLNEDQETFSENMQIVSINYTPDFATLELEEIRTNFGIELENFISSP